MKQDKYISLLIRLHCLKYTNPLRLFCRSIESSDGAFWFAFDLDLDGF